MAAGTAAERGLKVLLLEKMEKPGRKIRITGKGRCNLTNVKPAEEFLSYVQTNRDFFEPAFRNFNNLRVVKFFERQGVKLETERGGRVFPESGKAWEIAESLTDWCQDMGVQFGCRCHVKEIMTIGEGDRKRVRGIIYENHNHYERRVEATNVMIATGGASYPATGSTGDGYSLAVAMGHSIEPIRPSLVPLVTSFEDDGELEGLLLRNIDLKLLIDGELSQEEMGEMFFSTRGVEGAAVLRVSRKAVDALIDGRSVELVLDLKPPLDRDVLWERIGREIDALNGVETDEEHTAAAVYSKAEATIGSLLRKLMPREMVMPMSKLIGTHPRHNIDAFTDDMREKLIMHLKAFRLPIVDYGHWEEAIVTAGGVNCTEIDPETMQSRIVGNLYIVGELLDLDANTGGYNLQIAFSTGRLAGRNVEKESKF